MSSIFDPKVIDPEENVTYEFVPAEDPDEWHIRILEGMYNETVIKYDAISFNTHAENTMSFNFYLISSPDTELSLDDIGLQETAGVILQHIIKTAIERDDGTIGFRETEKEIAVQKK